MLQYDRRYTVYMSFCFRCALENVHYKMSAYIRDTLHIQLENYGLVPYTKHAIDMHATYYIYAIYTRQDEYSMMIETQTCTSTLDID